MRITRRDFVKSSLAAGAATAIPFSRVRGANDDIRVAVVGTGGKGSGHVRQFSSLPGVRVVAVCDADVDHMKRNIQYLQEQGQQAGAYQDVRKLLDDKDVDAVVTATPNHWHSLVTVWACQAGKDVYVEKPVSHEIWEGRKMVEAARKYNRIVQAGTQKRSDPGLMEAYAWIHEGNLGKILWARGLCYKRRESIGNVTEPQPIPESVDYDLWCGPAPKEPLMRKNLHYDWHWVWPTGNGDLGNQGIHEMDLARWALGQEKLAPAVMSIGGRFGYEDDGTTPNTLITFLDYKPAPLIFEVRGLPHSSDSEAMDHFRNQRIGMVVQCEEGYFAGGGGGGWVYDKDGKRVRQFKGDGGGGHAQNFIDAVRQRDVSVLNADILKGHVSSALCHMGNISYRMGARSNPEEIQDHIRDNREMTESYERFAEHLRANGVDLEKHKPALGPMLAFDPDQEVFTGEMSAQANRHLKRDYRKPYVVPEQV